jgi:hypothetical protein
MFTTSIVFLHILFCQKQHSNVMPFAAASICWNVCEDTHAALSRVGTHTLLHVMKGPNENADLEPLIMKESERQK